MRSARARLVFVGLALSAAADAAPLTEIADFDVDGDGIPSPALKITHIETARGGGFRLSQMLDLEPDRTYCVSLQMAVEPRAVLRSGRYRFAIELRSERQTHLTPPVPLGSVYRDGITMVVHSDGGGPSELVIHIEHDTGPTGDPVLYLDDIRATPVTERRTLTDSFEDEVVWVSPSTVLGWEHDFGAHGLTADDHIGSAEVEFVVWDDPETQRVPEVVVIEVNGIELFHADIGGTEQYPHFLVLRLPWLECSRGFGGLLVVRFYTVPGGGWPAGTLFFGAAHARIEAGGTGASVLENGDFDAHLLAWLCDRGPCPPVRVDERSWSLIKGLYR
ncbi:MAG: hypothetical protein ACE5G2_06980 [Candidatus Krumholzibacteriia bacterium]